MDKYYCTTREEVAGALSAALDRIDTPVEINHTKSDEKVSQEDWR